MTQTIDARGAEPEKVFAAQRKAFDDLCVRVGLGPINTPRAPLSDLRAKLMHAIDLVNEGKLTLDGARAVIKLADGVAAIDGFAGA